MTLWEKVESYFVEENYMGFLKLCLALLPFLFAVIGLIFLVFSFIGNNIEVFAVLGIAVLALIGVIASKKNEVVVDPPVNGGINNILFFDKLLYRGLFNIFKEYGQQFHVIPPTKFSDIKDDLPACFDVGKGCNIYRFKIMSDGECIEQLLFYELLTSKIEARLADGTLALGKAVVEFQNRLYPRLYIDEVVCVAGAWHIVLIICDTQEAANYIDSKVQYKGMKNSYAAIEDHDF